MNCTKCSSDCGFFNINCIIEGCGQNGFLSKRCYNQHKYEKHLNFLETDGFKYINECQVCGYCFEKRLHRMWYEFNIHTNSIEKFLDNLKDQRNSQSLNLIEFSCCDHCYNELNKISYYMGILTISPASIPNISISKSYTPAKPINDLLLGRHLISRSHFDSFVVLRHPPTKTEGWWEYADGYHVYDDTYHENKFSYCEYVDKIIPYINNIIYHLGLSFMDEIEVKKNFEDLKCDDHTMEIIANTVRSEIETQKQISYDAIHLPTAVVDLVMSYYNQTWKLKECLKILEDDISPWDWFYKQN